MGLDIRRIAFIELIAFGALASNWKGKIEQRQRYLDKGFDYITHIEILNLNKQLDDIYLGSGFFLASTLAAAPLGFRRRMV